jgi:hypothetical protein
MSDVGHEVQVAKAIDIHGFLAYKSRILMEKNTEPCRKVH